MPGHSGLPCADCVNLSATPGIHVFTAAQQERRGCPGHRRAGATPSFGRLCPGMTDRERIGRMADLPAARLTPAGFASVMRDPTQTRLNRPVARAASCSGFTEMAKSSAGVRMGNAVGRMGNAVGHLDGSYAGVSCPTRSGGCSDFGSAAVLTRAPNSWCG